MNRFKLILIFTAGIAVPVFPAASTSEPRIMLPDCLESFFPVQRIQPNQISIVSPDHVEDEQKYALIFEIKTPTTELSAIRNIMIFNQHDDIPIASYHFTGQIHHQRIRYATRISDPGKIYIVARLANNQLISGEKNLSILTGHLCDWNPASPRCAPSRPRCEFYSDRYARRKAQP